MAMYEFRYLHQTVEHCLKRPKPSNVAVAYRDLQRIVYTVDLPASVWAAVAMDVDDPYDNELVTFPSDSLRAEWIDNYIDSLPLTIP
jgi:hypothetical protein